MNAPTEPGPFRRWWLRRRMRLVIGLIVALLIYFLLHLYLVFHLQLIFPHHLTRHHLTAYMRQPVGPGMATVLDRVHSLLSASPLFDESKQRAIFLVNSYPLSEYLLFRNVHFGCNLPNGDTIITQADVEKDLAHCRRLDGHDHRLRSLSGSIAHEITHAMIREHVGYWQERRIPSWIKEGYCEFVSEGSAIDHDLGLRLLKIRSRPHVPGLQNFRCRLMVEFLLLGRGMTVDEILSAPPSRDETESIVLSRLRADAEGFLRELGSKIGVHDPLKPER